MTKKRKIPGIESVDFRDPGAVPGGGDEGFQQPLQAKLLFTEPRQPLLRDGGVLRQQLDFGSLAPKIGETDRIGHGQRLSEAARIRGDINKLRQDTGRQGKGVAGLRCIDGECPADGMVRMLRDRPCDEKTGVYADHASGSAFEKILRQFRPAAGKMEDRACGGRRRRRGEAGAFGGKTHGFFQAKDGLLVQGPFVLSGLSLENPMQGWRNVFQRQSHGGGQERLACSANLNP